MRWKCPPIASRRPPEEAPAPGRLLLFKVCRHNPTATPSAVEWRLAPEAGMIHRFVYHNDRLVPIEQVRLSPGQAGLLNGWGLFTTVRIVEGIPFAFERHWKRLRSEEHTSGLQ